MQLEHGEAMTKEDIFVKFKVSALHGAQAIIGLC